MKRIVISVQNGLLAEAITRTLSESGEFELFSVKNGEQDDIPCSCDSLSADILLMEVSYRPGSTLDECVYVAELVKKMRPLCKTALLCDDNSTPDIARGVTVAKQEGRIDCFFYSSVSDAYLAAALSSL